AAGGQNPRRKIILLGRFRSGRFTSHDGIGHGRGGGRDVSIGARHFGGFRETIKHSLILVPILVAIAVFLVGPRNVCIALLRGADFLTDGCKRRLRFLVAAWNGDPEKTRDEKDCYRAHGSSLSKKKIVSVMC